MLSLLQCAMVDLQSVSQLDNTAYIVRLIAAFLQIPTAPSPKPFHNLFPVYSHFHPSLFPSSCEILSSFQLYTWVDGTRGFDGIEDLRVFDWIATRFVAIQSWFGNCNFLHDSFLKIPLYKYLYEYPPSLFPRD